MARSDISTTVRPVSWDLTPCRKTHRRTPWLQAMGYSSFDWTHLELPVPDLPDELDGLRIVQVSDLHLHRRWEKGLQLLLDELAADPPDLVLLTGDLVEDKKDHRPAMPLVKQFLRGLSSRRGVYSILGNHDNFRLGQEMAGLGVRLLDGERDVVAVGGAELELIGLPGLLRCHLPADFCSRFAAKQHGRPRIVMGHFPDHLTRTHALEADVYLAGHTHGGQICGPGGWAMMRHDSMHRRYCKGVHRYGDTWLVVNRGMGFSQIPIRMFCPPEAIQIKLRSAHARGHRA